VLQNFHGDCDIKGLDVAKRPDMSYDKPPTLSKWPVECPSEQNRLLREVDTDDLGYACLE